MSVRLRLYLLLCVAHVRRHRLRLSFTVMGVTIGVASVVAILTINRIPSMTILQTSQRSLSAQLGAS